MHPSEQSPEQPERSPRRAGTERDQARPSQQASHAGEDERDPGEERGCSPESHALPGQIQRASESSRDRAERPVGDETAGVVGEVARRALPESAAFARVRGDEAAAHAGAVDAAEQARERDRQEDDRAHGSLLVTFERATVE